MSVTSITRSVEVVTAFFDAYRAHDVERMVELCADNADFHYVPFEVWGKQRVIRGDGKVRTIGKVIWRTLIDSFPDLTNEVTYLTSDDEGNVAVEVVISGTQAKPFSSIGNQGLHYDLPHVFLFRVGKEGLIEEITHELRNEVFEELILWAGDESRGALNAVHLRGGETAGESTKSSGCEK